MRHGYKSTTDSGRVNISASETNVTGDHNDQHGSAPVNEIPKLIKVHIEYLDPYNCALKNKKTKRNGTKQNKAKRLHW